MNLRIHSFAATTLCLFASVAGATPSTLTDGNSSINYDPQVQAGIADWIVDNKDQLKQQFFWYRVNNGPSPDTQENSFDSLTLSGVHQVDPSRVELTYSHAYFDVLVSINLNGGSTGTGTADLIEEFTFSKNANGVAAFGSTGLMDISFFQYSDFDLDATASGDSVFISQQFVQQSDGVTEFQESFTQSAPLPSRGEVGEASSILGKLTDSNVDDLATDLSNFGFASGTFADTAYAWQWDLTLNGQPVVLKNQGISGEPGGIGVIPEPTACLGWLGLAAAAMLLRHGRGQLEGAVWN